MTDAPRAIEVDQFLPHPPERVWEALTDREQLNAWFMATDFEPVEGHVFTLDTGRWGLTRCEVLRIEPPKLLRYSWRNGELDTEVTWQLAPEGRGTRLLVVHRGFEPGSPVQRAAYDGMSGGWRSLVLAELRRHLDRGGPPT